MYYIRIEHFRFEAFFIPKLEYLMEELQSKLDQWWDLVYIGRKILHNS